ncbi:23S rRNA (pseudouridine(1915)-N(3))-methyltransferase RlmH [Bacillus sp. FJAT-49711]|nr:23S rRNA (pseudouridine(1915)-N(3))-methyltransferase RlmH [Bacillus sp. FJAT-49711]
MFVISEVTGIECRNDGARDEVLSLSRMTFSHQLIKMILVVHVYRAVWIL